MCMVLNTLYIPSHVIPTTILDKSVAVIIPGLQMRKLSRKRALWNTSPPEC